MLLLKKSMESEGGNYCSLTKPNKTFRELIPQYLQLCKDNDSANTFRRNKGFFEIYKKFFPDDIKVSEMDVALIDSYKSHRKNCLGQRTKKPLKDSSIVCELFVLQSFFEMCIRYKEIETNPVKGVKKDKINNKKKDYLSKEELIKLIDNLEEITRTIVLTIVSTGCRKSEIFSLKWDNIDFENQLFHIDETKTVESRDVYPLAECFTEIKKIFRTKDCPYVFVNPKTGTHFTEIRKTFKTALLNAGITRNITLHTLRHSYASHQIMGGTDSLTVQANCGWKSNAMMQRYAHLSPEHKAKSTKVMSDIFNG